MLRTINFFYCLTLISQNSFYYIFFTNSSTTCHTHTHTHLSFVYPCMLFTSCTPAYYFIPVSSLFSVLTLVNCFFPSHFIHIYITQILFQRIILITFLFTWCDSTLLCPSSNSASFPVTLIVTFIFPSVLSFRLCF